MGQDTATGATGGVRSVLRLEGAAVLGLSLWLYQAQTQSGGAAWLWFAVFFLTPDLGMLGYLAGRRVGAASYNLAHSYGGALILAGLGQATAQPLLLQAALIWTAHIGFDRMLGYGLKYQAGFGFTHLGAIGKARRAAEA